MAINPFLKPLSDARTSAMAMPELQNLRTPVSIGAQAIQRFLGNRGGGYQTGQPGPVQSMPADGAPMGTDDNGNAAARNLMAQPNPNGGGMGALGTAFGSYGPEGGGSQLDQVSDLTRGPAQQTASGGVLGTVQPVDWGSYFRQRMGPPTGARAPRSPLMMRQARMDNQGY